MKKSTMIRLWLWAIISVVLFFGLLTQCSMNKPEIINRVVVDCSKNIPFSPVWQQDLRKSGIHPQQTGLPEYYCQCVLGDAMQKLSDKEVSELAGMSEVDRLLKLGGAAAIQQRNDACLEKWSRQAASQ